METMQAARLIEPGAPLEIHEVPVPEPAADEILVEVRACGICGTDLHLAVEGDIPVERTPITLGHEAAGIVAKTGKDVSDFSKGDRIALFPAAYCGVCDYCRNGHESLCESSKVYGMARDGALANFVAAPAHSAFHLPDNVPFDIGAVVTDAVSTPFHALRKRGKLQKGESVGVIGCGGLGSHAIQLAKMMEASPIVAIDIDPAARDRALKLGADIAIDPLNGDPVKTLREFLGKSGLDVALEFVGRPETVELTIRCLTKGGRAVLVGVGMGKPSLPRIAAFVGRELSVLGSFGMDRSDIEELYELISSGQLDLSDSISARYPLEQANNALQHLARKDESVVRVVVEPNKPKELF